MPPRPRGTVRGSSRRMPTSTRKSESKRNTHSPPRSFRMIRSSPSRRPRRSPKMPRKPIVSRSPIKRRLSLSPRRRGDIRKRSDMRLPPKMSRDSPKSRKLSPEKKYPEKPTYGAPEEDLRYNKEDLKKITMNITRDFSGGSTQINRSVVHPEDITIVRRPGEGSTPIFHRQEIIENRRKYDDIEPAQSDRSHCEPSTSYNDNYRERDYYSDKEKDRNLSNNVRRSPREYERSRDERPRARERYHSLERSRGFDRPRDFQERKNRYDERDVHRGPRRSLERDARRSHDRLIRRHPSPESRSLESRRHGDQFRDYEDRDRRARSLERRSIEISHHRDHQEHPPGDRFQSPDRSSRSRGYHEPEDRGSYSSSKGRGGFHSRGRGGSVSGRPFVRSTPFIPRSVSHSRTIRMVPFPRTVIRPVPVSPRKSFRLSLRGRY